MVPLITPRPRILCIHTHTHILMLLSTRHLRLAFRLTLAPCGLQLAYLHLFEPSRVRRAAQVTLDDRPMVILITIIQLIRLQATIIQASLLRTCIRTTVLTHRIPVHQDIWACMVVAQRNPLRSQSRAQSQG